MTGRHTNPASRHARHAGTTITAALGLLCAALSVWAAIAVTLPRSR